MASDVFAVITIASVALYDPLAVAVVNDETVGRVVSTTNVWVTADDVLPTASVAVTETELLPFALIESVPLAGVALPVSTDQFPPVAVTEYVAPAMTADTVAFASAVPLTVGVESFDNAEDVIATDGAVVSITIVFVPNIDDAAGKVVDVIAFPAVSATVPIEKLLTVKPEEVSPAPTVYVPTNVVPADAAVNKTVSVVSNVTVIVFPF